MGASGPSFGPLMNPSSETESPVRTLPISVSLPILIIYATFAARNSAVVMGECGRPASCSGSGVMLPSSVGAADSMRGNDPRARKERHDTIPDALQAQHLNGDF
jgi:hypothetical protein